ncbi:MAG: hypothetical protein ABI382_13260 [Nakamurella sp.]
MAWWQWTAAAVEAALLTILTLLWLDTLRERRGWQLARHKKLLIIPACSIPVGFLVVLVAPLWLALILIAVPALSIVVMAMAS